MHRTQDGSIIARDGRTLFYSWPRFVTEICEGDHCFICGRSPQATAFNREHILPNWLLHQFNLHGKSITLPNGQEHRYGTYRLPCCVDCNLELGANFETPISTAVAQGFRGVDSLISREGPMRLFIWMALIFLKLHLKDGRLRMHLDQRLGEERIGDGYNWETFHHLHSLARSAHTQASIDNRVAGSLVVMELMDGGDPQVQFDFASVTAAQCLYLRLGDVAIFTVFDDAAASVMGLENLIARIDGPLAPLQAREFLAELAACNLHLENRPRFGTRVTDGAKPTVDIEVFTDPASGPRFSPKDDAVVGHFKYDLLKYWVGQISVSPDAGRPEDLLQANGLSLLFDDEGQFIRHRQTP
ncbi:MAG TPA: hypothetical protein VN018_10425 [Brevundimonas sp.]|nr:hypothetical protein [Brevundimonas sp.]